MYYSGERVLAVGVVSPDVVYKQDVFLFEMWLNFFSAHDLLRYIVVN